MTPAATAKTETKHETWRAWLLDKFPKAVWAGFAERHEEFWQWVWSIEEGQRPRPFVAIWPRGGGKSSSSELAVVALGARGVRRYCIYVCETQAQADDHVSAIADKLAELGLERALDKYGQSKGWRRNRVRAANFTVDALGLDVASRGKKIDDDRPDLIIFDDVDNQNDSPKIVTKKRKTITKSILPAMAAGCAVLFCQNLIHSNSIASQLSDGRADFLSDRIVSGPHKAASHLRVEPTEVDYDGQRRIRHVVIECAPTWDGQSAVEIQQAIDTFGLQDFQAESQHDVFEREGALWTRARLGLCYIDKAPPLVRVGVGIDPSGGGNEIGIIVAGIDAKGNGYVLSDRSVVGKAGSRAWGTAGCRAYHEFEADKVFAESNFGGDMVKSNIKAVDESVPVELVHASRGKFVRAEPVATLYGDEKTPTRIFHVGTFTALETEMTTWTPEQSWSPNRIDALVWVLTKLMLGNTKTPSLPQSFGGTY